MQKDIDERALWVFDHCVEAHLGDVGAWGADTVPEDAVPVPQECHAVVLKVLENRAQGLEVVDTKDEVETSRCRRS